MKIDPSCLVLNLLQGQTSKPTRIPHFHINEADIIPASLELSCIYWGA